MERTLSASLLSAAAFLCLVSSSQAQDLLSTCPLPVAPANARLGEVGERYRGARVSLTCLSGHEVASGGAAGTRQGSIECIGDSDSSLLSWTPVQCRAVPATTPNITVVPSQSCEVQVSWSYPPAYVTPDAFQVAAYFRGNQDKRNPLTGFLVGNASSIVEYVPGTANSTVLQARLSVGYVLEVRAVFIDQGEISRITASRLPATALEQAVVYCPANAATAAELCSHQFTILWVLLGLLGAVLLVAIVTIMCVQYRRRRRFSPKSRRIPRILVQSPTQVGAAVVMAHGNADTSNGDEGRPGTNNRASVAISDGVAQFSNVPYLEDETEKIAGLTADNAIGGSLSHAGSETQLISENEYGTIDASAAGMEPYMSMRPTDGSQLSEDQEEEIDIDKIYSNIE